MLMYRMAWTRDCGLHFSNVKNMLCIKRARTSLKTTMVTTIFVLYVIVKLNTLPPKSREVSVPISGPRGEHCVEMPVSSEKFYVSFKLKTFEELNILHGKNISAGGHFTPLSCKPDQKVAIVIPYRDREAHLKMLLNNLHPFLKHQNIDYTIFVVEQLPGSNFNRGMLKNIGFLEALKIRDFDCFFFHDIDMVPDNYANVYRCGQQPRQHSRSLPRWNHYPPNCDMFGGVVSMKAEQFRKANGYPTIYFEWGAEDDELGRRLVHRNIKIVDYPLDVSTYQEFDHVKSSVYVNAHLYKKWLSRVDTDGLNSVRNYYMLEKIDFKKLYTHIAVSINMTAVKEANNGEILQSWGSSIPVPMVFLRWYAEYFL